MSRRRSQTRVPALRLLRAGLVALPVNTWPFVGLLLTAMLTSGPAVLDTVLFILPAQGVAFPVTLGTAFLVAAMTSLVFELSKSAWSNRQQDAFVDFALSLLLGFFHALVFFAAPGYAVDVLFYMMLVAIIDVFAGLIIAFRVGRLNRRIRGFYAARRMMRGA